NLLTLDAGFQPGGTLITWLDLSRLRLPAERRQPVKKESLNRLRAIPGVEAASEVGIVPLSGGSMENRVWRDGADRQAGFDPKKSGVGEAYSQTRGPPFWAGRDFEERDTPLSP